jgi:sugar lactone lactonase YvrE
MSEQAVSGTPVPLPVPASTVGEGPCWDGASGSLYWVDIPPGQVHRLDGEGAHRRWDIGQPVGAAVLRSSGGLVLAARDGFLTLDPESGAIAPLVTLALPEGCRMNDGACDQAGRFFAGSMDDDEAPGRGTLYRLDPDHSVAEVIPQVTISNGIGWSPDGGRMYYVDSPTRRVDVLDYDPATGAAAERRPFARIDAGEAVPDGLAVDAEGCVWVALWDGRAVVRFGPDGRLRDSVELPTPRVSSCAFGGADLETLFITTAAAPDGSGGELFSVPAGVPGLATHAYQG